MSLASRNLTRRIATIASKTAAKASPITEGTVISRNPDGTLNVDDGRGGCLRQAPPANYRVGQKIKLGVEPALGTQTNLPQVTLDIDASTIPCPDDPRGECEDMIGALCPVPTPAPVNLAGQRFNILWESPNNLTGYAAREDGNWHYRLSASREVRGGPDYTNPNGSTISSSIFSNPGCLESSVFRRTRSYTNTTDFGAPWADQVTYVATRCFMSFDTRNVPADAVISDITLRLIVRGNIEDTTTGDNFIEDVVIVPSDHNGNISGSTIDKTNWDKVFPDAVLATISIRDLLSGPGSLQPPAQPPGGYAIDVPLSLGLAEQYVVRGGVTKLALMTSRDADPNSELPPPLTFGTAPVLTASTVPDNQVHLSGGTYVADGVQYVAGSFTFAFEQVDSHGAPLIPGSAYSAAAYLNPTTGQAGTVKGGQAPLGTQQRPQPPAGSIVVGWLQCRQNGSLEITPDDIAGWNSSSFLTPANPNEIREDFSRISFGYSFADADNAQLIITFADMTGRT